MAQLALWSFLLLAGAQLALGRPQGSDSPPELILKPGCSESAMFRCVSPVISFVMSADGQRLMKIRKSGAIQQPDFEKACRYVNVIDIILQLKQLEGSHYENTTLVQT